MSSPRAIYLVQEGQNGPIYIIETPESYRNRKSLPRGRVSTLRKSARINRVAKVGFTKRLATPTQISKYGPPIVVGEDAEAA